MKLQRKRAQLLRNSKTNQAKQLGQADTRKNITEDNTAGPTNYNYKTIKIQLKKTITNLQLDKYKCLNILQYYR